MQTMQRDESLRDRKRRLARTATQRVAIELSLEHGVDNVSVEMICDAVGISPRTFYNYFGTREIALIGDEKPLPTEEQIEAFVAREGVSDVEAFAELMAQVWVDAQPDRDLYRLRRRLLDANAELAGANWARITRAREQYAGIVRRRLAVTAPGRDAAALDSDAALVVHIAMGILQVAARGWACHEDEPDLDSLVTNLFPQLRRLTQAAPAPIPTA